MFAFHSLFVYCITYAQTGHLGLSVLNNEVMFTLWPHCSKNNRPKCPVLLLVMWCDASYNFSLVEIDQYGSTNDISALNNSEMEKAFEDGSMSLPQPEHLPGCGLPQLPFYLVGDEISALEPWLLRPYQGKIIKRKRAYLIIVCPEPEGLLRTV